MAKEQKRAMGRGLSALLNNDLKNIQTAKDDHAKEVLGNILEITIEDIIPNPNQPRTHFDAQSLEELKQSITQLGIIQPLTVRKNNQGKYDLISGERRYRASQLAGLKQVPAFVRLANDQELLEMALVENIQREDLNAIEIALTYEKLIEEIQLTQENLSKRVGKDRSTITNYLRLLKLHPTIQSGIKDSKISMGHGRALIAIEDQNLQLLTYTEIISRSLSVRETEAYIKQLKNVKKASTPTKEIIYPNHIKKGLKQMEDFFELPIEIKTNKNGAQGKIIISFESQEEFEKLQNLLK